MDISNGQDELEIKELKEFIQKIYFKQNEEDLQKKEQLINSIQELQEIAGDEDFSLHLAKLYSKIITRQKENLQEFERDRNIVDNYKRGVIGKENELNQGLNSLTDECRNLPINLSIVLNQLSEQERQVDYFDQIATKHLKSLLDTCEEQRNGQDKRKQEDERKIQAFKEKEAKYKQDRDDMQDEIIRNREGHKQEEQEIEDIQKSIKNSQEMIKKITQESKKLLEEDIEGNYDNEGLKKKQEKLRDLLEKKKSIVENIIQLRVTLEKHYQADNRVIEKRYSLEEILLPYSSSSGKDTLQLEGIELAQQQVDLAKQIEGKQYQGQKIQEQINQLIIENGKGRHTQSMLIAVLVLFALMLVYRVL